MIHYRYTEQYTHEKLYNKIKIFLKNLKTYLKRPYYNLTELTEEQSRDRLLSFIEYCRIQEMTIPRSQRLRWRIRW